MHIDPKGKKIKARWARMESTFVLTDAWCQYPAFSAG